MTPETPIIQLVSDAELLTTAFRWQDQAPRWFQDSQEPETLDEFIASEERSLFYGVFAPDLTALVRLSPIAGRMLLADLFARRGTDLEMLTNACASIQQFLIATDVTNGFVGWIPEMNRPIRRLYADLGFTDTGIRCLRATGHHTTMLMLMSFEVKTNGKEND